MRRSVRFLVGIVAVAVLATGCGGDSEDESSSTTTPATSETTASPATTGPPTSDPRNADQLAADRAAAERAVLKLADLPPGWTGEPDTDDSTPELQAAQQRFATCLGVDPAFIGGGARAGARAESDDFEDDDNHQVQNTVTMVFSRERALQQLETFRKPEARGCFESFVDSAFQLSLRNPGPGQTAPPGLSFGEARVEVLSVGGLNTDAVAYRARVPVTVRNQTAEAVFDIVLALKGRAGITMIFIAIGEPFPAALETSLTNTVISRAPSS
jgi:hypothetical protein